MEIFTLDTDPIELDEVQVKTWLRKFRNLVENAFVNCNNEQRILGNLLDTI